jgi:hypothetical protein
VSQRDSRGNQGLLAPLGDLPVLWLPRPRQTATSAGHVFKFLAQPFAGQLVKCAGLPQRRQTRIHSREQLGLVFGYRQHNRGRSEACSGQAKQRLRAGRQVVGSSNLITYYRGYLAASQRP